MPVKHPGDPLCIVSSVNNRYGPASLKRRVIEVFLEVSPVFFP